MFRPKRSNDRFTGEADGTEGITTLSAMNEQASRSSPDGRTMRRRYAIGAVACLVLVAIIISVTVGKGDKGGPSSSASGGSGETIDLGPYEIPKSPLASYELIESDTIEELLAAVAVYKHTKSGLRVMTMIPKDPNQDATFGLNFRTPPENDDGAQFVVQHSVLAGSANYPIKDPFNQVERGSLQTYWNTWTKRDRTSFVIASRNLADFKNNIKVMIDAVFHPLFVNPAYKWIYRQEGWRLESPDDKHLKINGNAFTAAKAAQMDPQEVMEKQIYKNLFANHVYSRNPKGEASEVVTMTYQEVIDYYNAYYHPSNGEAFCYGKQDFIDACLTELDPVLNEYDHNDGIRQHSKVPWKDLTELASEEKSIGYPSWQDSIDYRSVMAWVLNDQPMDLRTEVAWHLIYELLVGSPTAPVTKAIVDLNLGDDLITFFEHSLQQWVIAVGVSGVSTQEKVEIARKAIVGKLQNIVNNGFDEIAVTAALNKLEFKFRDQSGKDMPRGVQTFEELLGHWNYDRDPLMPLKYGKAFMDLKAEVEQPFGQDFLLQLLTRRMFDSKHSTYLDLYPDKNYALQWEQMEIQWLNSLDQYITVEQGAQMLEETDDLKRVQAVDDSEDALALIPHVQVSDLGKELYAPPTNIFLDLFDSGITTLEHELVFTNGIAYVDFAIDISNMDFDDIVLLPLFCRLLREAGTKTSSEVQIQYEVDKSSGGISIYPIIEEVVQADSDGNYVVPDGKHLVSKIVVSGSCVAANSCLPMFNLFRKMLWESDVQNKIKAHDLLEEMIDDMEDDIQTNGHLYTTTRIASRYSITGFIREQWQGLTQLFQMRRALEQAKSDFSELSLRLIKMQDAMVRGNRNGMTLAVTGDRAVLKDLKGAVELFMKDVLPLATQVERFPDFAQVEHPWIAKGMHRMEAELSHENSNQAIIVPTRVNHVGKGGLLYDIGERIVGADTVVTSFLGGYYLYDQLRFNLGALHAWAVLDSDSGVLIYQSDRDPNILQTLKVYEEGATWLWKQIQDGELPIEAKSSIVGTIGRMDATVMRPNLIGIESIKRYLKQETPEMRQRWRDQIIGATTDDFMSMVERLGSWGQPSVCVVTSTEVYDTIDPLDLNMTHCSFAGFEC